MTDAEYLELVRQLLVDNDPSAYSYEDDELFRVTKQATRHLAVKQVRGLGDYTVDVDGQSITPDFSDLHGTLVAHAVARSLLADKFRDLVARGEFGISWRSGLEQESSEQAARAYAENLDALRAEVDALILANASTTFMTRPQ